MCTWTEQSNLNDNGDKLECMRCGKAEDETTDYTQSWTTIKQEIWELSRAIMPPLMFTLESLI